MSGLVYLAGGMEHAENGHGWRTLATEYLAEKGMKTWNPYTEEKTFFDFDIQDFLKSHDKEKDYKALNEVMRRIVISDFGIILKDVGTLMVRYDKSVLGGAGTHAEISFATYLNIPVHVWLDNMELREVPLWAIGCFTTVSKSFEETVMNVVEGQ